MNGSGSSIPKGGEPPRKKSQISGKELSVEASEVKIEASEVKKRAILGLKEESTLEDIKLYSHFPGGYRPIKNISPELKQTLRDIRAAAINYVWDHYGKNYKGSLDFKNSTCKVYDPKSLESFTVNVELPEKMIEHLKELFDGNKELSGLISTEGWHKMKPGQISFFGTGRQVIGNLNFFSGSPEEEIYKFVKANEGKMPEPKIPISEDKLTFNINEEELDAKIQKIGDTCTKAINGYGKKIEEKKTNIETLRQEANNSDTSSSRRNELNTNANALNTEIQELEAKIKAYQELKDNQFAMTWVLALKNSSLANLPRFNAQYSYWLLNKFIHEKEAGFFCSPKDIDAYCRRVSAMLIPTRGERVEFLWEHSADLEEISLDERVLNASSGNNNSDEIQQALEKQEELETSSSPMIRDETGGASHLRAKVERKDIETKEAEKGSTTDIEINEEEGTSPGAQPQGTPPKAPPSSEK